MVAVPSGSSALPWGARSVLVAVAFSVLLAARAWGQAEFHGLGTLADSTNASYARGISGDGTVVAGDVALTGTTSFRAFVWTEAGGMVQLPGIPPYVPNAHAYGVSGDGSILVGTSVASPGTRAVHWTTAGAITVDGALTTGNVSASGRAASRDGSVIVGFSDSANGREAFREVGGVMAGLGDLAGGAFTSFGNGVSGDGSIVVGEATTGTFTHRGFFWSADSGMVALPSPAGATNTSAAAVSADGRYAVGYSTSGPNVVAVRWDLVNWAVQTVGDLPGGATSGYAYAVNGDGSVVVGSGVNAVETEAFIWTQATGIQSLRQTLVNDGVDMTGWKLTAATGVSEDGKVVVGYGVNPAGRTEAWMAILGPRVVVTSPGEDDFLVAGEDAFATWISNGVADVTVFFEAAGVLTAIAAAIPADSALTWTVPPTARSTHCRLIVQDASDATVADTTGFFKVKGYELTRLDANGEYEAFDPALNGWSWSNEAVNQWTVSELVDYAGVDPNTGLNYPVFFTTGRYAATSEVFPSWPVWARAFGTGLTYADPGAGLYCEEAVQRWSLMGHTWGGSCGGFSVGALQAFDDPVGFELRFPGTGLGAHLHDLPLNAANRSIINALQTRQMQRAHEDYLWSRSEATSPTEALAEIRASLISPATDHRWLYIANNNGDMRGAHAVVPYRVEKDGSDAWVYVYDPNFPGDAGKRIHVAPSSNFGLGSWTYDGQPAWGGFFYLIFMDAASTYLDIPSSLAPGGGILATAQAADSLIEAYIDTSCGTVLSAGGDSTGYVNGGIVGTLTGAIPIRIPTGHDTPPLGFALPDGDYDIRLNGFTLGRSRITLSRGGITWGLGRAGAGPGETDLLRLSVGLRYENPDTGSKAVSFHSDRDDGSFRAVDIGDLVSDAGDSLILTWADPQRPKLANPGAGKTYSLDLRFSPTPCGSPAAPKGAIAPAGVPSAGLTAYAFHAEGVPLAAGASHIIAPVWDMLDAGPLTILVDLGDDGSIDDTLHIQGSATTGTPDLPGPANGAFTLGAAFPNPTRGVAVLRYGLAREGRVEVVLFDVAGRRVAALVDGVQAAGDHEVTVDGGDLPAGIYFARMTAGGHRETRRIAVLK